MAVTVFSPQTITAIVTGSLTKTITAIVTTATMPIAIPVISTNDTNRHRNTKRTINLKCFTESK